MFRCLARALYMPQMSRVRLYSAAADKVKLKYVVQGTGKEYQLEAKLGDNLWHVAHENEIPLEGACEGNGACGTCHVILNQEVYKKIAPAKEEEEDLLQIAFGRKACSRLGCQVKVTKELEGVTITIPSQTRNIKHH